MRSALMQVVSGSRGEGFAAGGRFPHLGLAVAPDGAGLHFVDDGSNTLNFLH